MFCQISSTICSTDLPSPSGGSTVMPVVLRKYSKQRAVEAVEDNEVVLAGNQVRRTAGAAAEHLLEQDAGLDRTQEDEEFKVGNIDASREQIDRHDDLRVRPIAELADLLQRSVDTSRDLADKGFSTTEDVACLVDKLISMRRVRNVIDGEDQGLREATRRGFVLVGVALDLFQDLAVRVGRGDVALHLAGVVCPLVFEEIELAGARARVDLVDLFALLEEDAIHADIAVDRAQRRSQRGSPRAPLARSRSDRPCSRSRPSCERRAWRSDRS